MNEASREFYDTAKAFLEKSDFKAAVIQLKNAIRSDGSNAEARLELAKIYLRLGNGPSAEKELKAARANGLGEDRLLVPLAQSYALQGKNREILNELQPGDRPQEVDAGIRAARGGAYIALHDLDAAERELSAAAENAPRSVAVLLGLSKVLQAKGFLDKAEAQADRALAVAPDNKRALVQKGSLQQAAKRYDAAIETFGRAIDQNDDNVLARVARAGAYMALNDDAAARRDVDAALKTAPNYPIARFLSALLLARERQYDAAHDVLQPVMPALLEHAPALYLQASLSLARGLLEQAQTQARGYLGKAPLSARGKRLLATVFLRKNATASAIDILEPMVRAAPEEPLNWTLLGEAYLAANRYQEAAALFDKLVKSNPRNTKFRTKHAVTQLGAGDHENAVRAFESILQIDPDDVRVTLLLVTTHLRESNFQAALDAALRLHKRMLDNPIPDNLIGLIYLRKGELETARRHFERALETNAEFTPAALNLADIDKTAGRLDLARTRYEAILARDETQEQAMLRLAQIDFAENDRVAGIKWLRRAIAANPKSLRPRIELADTLLRFEEIQKALTVAREAVQTDKKDPDALDVLARAQIAAGKVVSGIVTYRQLIALVPNSSLAQYRFGRALAAGKDYSQAAEHLDRAIALEPDFIAAKELRVRVAYVADGPEKALSLARQYTTERPDTIFGHVLQGDVHMHDGSYDAASEAYAAAQQKQPSGQVLRRLYRSYLRAGKLDEAKAVLKDWLTANPQDTSIRFMYADVLTSTGNIAGAIRENEELLKSFPDNAGLLNDLAWLYAEKRDGRAIDYAKRAHELAPDSPAIAGTLGSLLVMGGDTEQALEHLRRAYDGSPDHPEIGYYFAVALVDSGDTDKAVTLLKKVLDAGKKFNAIDEARKLYQDLATK